jgi:glutathione peroxidase
MHRLPRPLVAALAAAALAACAACGGEADDGGRVTAVPAGDLGPGLLVGRARSIDGDAVPLKRFLGGAVLVVNTASRCGFTPQFEALETLYRSRRGDGLTVIAYPSDDFRQELDEDGDIAEFCRLRYGVSFPVMAKTRVTGEAANPLFAAIAARPGPAGEEPSWNFTKYLLDDRGRLVARFEPSVEPDDPRLADAIEEVLARRAL